MTLGVLLMAYGTPRRTEEVAAYYTHMRGGRPPSPERLAELQRRYAAIGGQSPLFQITQAQAAGLQAALDGRRPGRFQVATGMKHAAPFIEEAVPALLAEGVSAVVGLVLAPHYSALSVGEYHQRAAAAVDRATPGLPYLPVRSWHLAPAFLDVLATRVGDTLAQLPAPEREEALVVFSAHSLPTRTRAMGDPYPDQVAETGAAVAARVGLARWTTAWQSASTTGEPWLGPDLLEVIGAAREQGRPAVVSCPCGFTADHLEILYDIDIEAQAAARRLGVRLLRTPSPNADPDFCGALADVVEQAAA